MTSTHLVPIGGLPVSAQHNSPDTSSHISTIPIYFNSSHRAALSSTSSIVPVSPIEPIEHDLARAGQTGTTTKSVLAQRQDCITVATRARHTHTIMDPSLNSRASATPRIGQTDTVLIRPWTPGLRGYSQSPTPDTHRNWFQLDSRRRLADRRRGFAHPSQVSVCATPRTYPSWICTNPFGSRGSPRAVPYLRALLRFPWRRAWTNGEPCKTSSAYTPPGAGSSLAEIASHAAARAVSPAGHSGLQECVRLGREGRPTQNRLRSAHASAAKAGARKLPRPNPKGDAESVGFLLAQQFGDLVALRLRAPPGRRSGAT